VRCGKVLNGATTNKAREAGPANFGRSAVDQPNPCTARYPFLIPTIYFLRMHRIKTLTVLVGLSIACAKPNPQAPATAPAPEHALSGLAAQHVAVLPTYRVRVDSALGWSVGRPTELQRTLDADILAAFEERGLRRAWLFPEDLAASYRRNPTYGTDPFALAEEPLRAPNLAVDQRLPEPLASQIRTLVALQQDVRLVLAPVEVRVERAQPSGGRGVLRVVLLDARLSNVRWIGDVESDRMSSFGPALSASIANRLAGVVSPR